MASEHLLHDNYRPFSLSSCRTETDENLK